MAVRLTIDESRWRAHVSGLATELPGLVPVVKGNGYGFGRVTLAELAVEFLGADTLAVGTVYELSGLPPGVTAVVLTPTMERLPEACDESVVLTVGASHHVEVLRGQGWRGRVVLKLASSMRRYGTHDVASLLAECSAAGLELVGASLHPSLAGSVEDHVAEISRWVPEVASLLPGRPFAVSHVDPQGLATLLDRHPEVPLQIRVGTALWHGDKSFIHLGATVTDLHPISAGQTLGYRAVASPVDGHVVVVGAGSAHGVQPLEGGLSPFHHQRRRLALVEAPHMHSSMVLVPAGHPCPDPGELLDLQRPLISTDVDELVWT